VRRVIAGAMARPRIESHSLLPRIGRLNIVRSQGSRQILCRWTDASLPVTDMSRRVRNDTAPYGSYRSRTGSRDAVFDESPVQSFHSSLDMR
jgi:hypothetical protein